MSESDDQSDDSVTAWIGDLKAGDDQAINELWQRYFGNLVGLAARRLGAAPKRIADEEDVAVSVFDSLCRGAAAGRFQQLRDRDDLWKLLTAITGMKVVDQIRRQTAQKRGGTDVRGESIFAGDGREHDAGLAAFIRHDPTPEFLAVMDEQRNTLFELLPDQSQRDVARLRLEGYSNEEIAQQLELSLRTVERKLQVIRTIWSSAIESSEDQS